MRNAYKIFIANPPPVSILNQSVFPPLCFPKRRFDMILASTSWSSEWIFSLDYPAINLYWLPICRMRATYSANLTLLDMITFIPREDKFMKLNFSSSCPHPLILHPLGVGRARNFLAGWAMVSLLPRTWVHWVSKLSLFTSARVKMFSGMLLG